MVFQSVLAIGEGAVWLTHALTAISRVARLRMLPLLSLRPGTVPIIEISGAHGAMIAATELVSIAGEPPIEPVSKRPHEWDPE